MRFGSNAILELVDLGFDALLQLPRSFLHLVILGLFGHHIIKAIIHLIGIYSFAKKECTSAYGIKGQSGKRKAPIPENAIKGVLQCRDWPIGGLPQSQTNHALPLQLISLGISSKWLSRAVLCLLAIA